MNRPLAVLLMTLGLAGSFVRPALAETYELIDKTVMNGQALAPDRRGIIIKGEDGTLSERVPWTNFTQNTLKKISQLPAAKPFLELYLEPDEPESAKKARPEITIKLVPRLERPDPRAGVGAIFSSSLSVTLFFILYLANLYAGYEISLFRNYPPGWVCGAAAVAPVAGPVIFLCLPTRVPKTAEEAPGMPQEELVAAGDAAGMPLPGQGDGSEAPPPVVPAAGAPKHAPPTIYLRGQTTFNRRFFETKLAGFMRVVPSEAEKDMVIFMRSSRGEHTGQRITRVTPNELFLQITKGNASNDVIIPYSEIQEVQIRHKEAG